MEIFISYSSKDKDYALNVATKLREQGFTVWRDQEGIEPGGHFPLRLQQALLRCEILLYFNSRTAVESIWVGNELNFAQAHKKEIIPLLLEKGIDLPLVIYTLQGIPMYDNADEGFSRLLGYLQQRVTKTDPKIGTSELKPFEPKVAAAPTLQPPADAGTAGAVDPFWFGNAVPENSFFGRAAVLRDVISAIVGQRNDVRSISIVGNRRIGKTSLLNYIVKRSDTFLPDNCKRVFVYIDMMDARAREIPDFMRVLRRGIRRQIEREPWEERHDGSLGRLSDAIEDLALEHDSPLVLCLDEWETAMAYPELERLLETMRSHGSQKHLSMIIASADSLLDLTNNAAIGSPFYNIFSDVYLGLMPRPEWTQIVEHAFLSNGVKLDWGEGAQLLDAIERWTGGHPYLVQLAGSLFWRGRSLGWSAKEIEGRYLYHARTVFSWTLQRVKPEQLAALRGSASGNPPPNVPPNMWREMQDRGLVDDQQQPFCEPFAQFLRETM